MTDQYTIVAARIIDAPRSLVFKAWEDPEILITWWGPKDFTNTFHAFDFIPGGTWSFTMHGPDGANYHNTNIFENIVVPELIVFTHQQPVHQFKATVSFDEVDDKTKIVWHILFESAEECARVRPFIAIANEQNFDRLEAALAKMAVVS